MSDAPMVDLVHLCKQFDQEGAFLMSDDELREKYEQKILETAFRAVMDSPEFLNSIGDDLIKSKSFRFVTTQMLMAKLKENLDAGDVEGEGVTIAQHLLDQYQQIVDDIDSKLDEIKKAKQA